jgi:hypothetical protein
MRKKTSTEELKKRRNKFIESTPQGATGRVKNRKVEEPVKTKSKSGKTYTKAQLMAQKRIAAKKAGTYKKPKTAKELAKARLKIKKK